MWGGISPKPLYKAENPFCCGWLYPKSLLSKFWHFPPLTQQIWSWEPGDLRSRGNLEEGTWRGKGEIAKMCTENLKAPTHHYFWVSFCLEQKYDSCRPIDYSCRKCWFDLSFFKMLIVKKKHSGFGRGITQVVAAPAEECTAKPLYQSGRKCTHTKICSQNFPMFTCMCLSEEHNTMTAKGKSFHVKRNWLIMKSALNRAAYMQEGGASGRPRIKAEFLAVIQMCFEEGSKVLYCLSVIEYVQVLLKPTGCELAPSIYCVSQT